MFLNLMNKNLVSMLSSCFLIIIISQVSFAGDVDEGYTYVALDQYIKENRPHKKNGKSIIPPKNISFHGQVMQLPRSGEFKYVYMAMDIMQVVPTPEISDQMYISDKQGNVVSMYVEKNAAKIFNKYIKVGEWLHFKGFHIYNYKRGPAIVLEGLVKDIKSNAVESIEAQ